MKVRELMTTDVRSCTADTDLGFLVAAFWRNDCGALPVVDDSGKVIGMITDRDISVALATRHKLPADVTVGEVMSPKVYSCGAGEDVRSAMRKMQVGQVRRLPVVSPTELTYHNVFNSRSDLRYTLIQELSQWEDSQILQSLCCYQLERRFIRE
jgi:CBS domain-containing protein